MGYFIQFSVEFFRSTHTDSVPSICHMHAAFSLLEMTEVEALRMGLNCSCFIISSRTLQGLCSLCHPVGPCAFDGKALGFLFDGSSFKRLKQGKGKLRGANMLLKRSIRLITRAFLSCIRTWSPSHPALPLENQ